MNKALDKNHWNIEKRDDLLLVFSPLLAQFPKLVHAFTTRQGGQSKPPFDSFNIGINQTTDEEARQDARKNRVTLCRTLNIPSEQLKTAMKLVHSTDVVMLETVDQPGEVDGILTRKTLSPVYMTFADCVPVIIYDPIQHLFCVIHAGWRGTAGGITKEAIKFMVNECDSQAPQLVCAIGPAIGSCCYPIGLNAVEKLLLSLVKPDQLNEILQNIEQIKADVSLEDWFSLSPDCLKEITTAFWSIIENMALTKFFIRGEKQIYVDLKAINAAQLIHSGVEHIDVTDLCTSCREDIFYSYRRSYVREEGPTGRQSAIACLL